MCEYKRRRHDRESPDMERPYMENAQTVHYELSRNPSPNQRAAFLQAVDDLAVCVNLRRLLVKHVARARNNDGSDGITAHLIAPLAPDSSYEATILAQFTLLPGRAARRKDAVKGRTAHEITDFLNVGVVDTAPNASLGNVSSVMLSSVYFYRDRNIGDDPTAGPSFVRRKRMPVDGFPVDWYDDLVERIKLAAYRALAFRRYWG